MPASFATVAGALASLQGLDDSERVIYVGTLNKALFPGLRLGYAVVPPGLLRDFVTSRCLVDRQPASLSQAVGGAIHASRDISPAHIRRMRRSTRSARCSGGGAAKRGLGATDG